jgi:hypothetical protein
MVSQIIRMMRNALYWSSTTHQHNVLNLGEVGARHVCRLAVGHFGLGGGWLSRQLYWAICEMQIGAGDNSLS